MPDPPLALVRRAKERRVNKTELVEEITQSSDSSKAQAQRYTDTLQKVLTEALKGAEEVQIPGFGKFYVREQKAREGINPQTREKMRIPAQKVCPPSALGRGSRRPSRRSAELRCKRKANKTARSLISRDPTLLFGASLADKVTPEIPRARSRRRRMAMQGPWGDEAIRGLDGYEQMVDNFAEQAKAYWRLWGPLGEPMVRGVDAWAEGQRAYLQWLRTAYGAGRQP